MGVTRILQSRGSVSDMGSGHDDRRSVLLFLGNAEGCLDLIVIVAVDLLYEPPVSLEAPSPVLDSDIFDGETYDARIKKDVPSPGETFGVKPIEIDMNRLEARRSLPVRINEEIKPVAVIRTRVGETVLDMGIEC